MTFLSIFFWFCILLGIDHANHVKAASMASKQRLQEEYNLKATQLFNKQLRCLEKVVWLEARGEDIRSMRLVAQVIVNRSNHESFPPDVCSVVAHKQYNNGINMLRKVRYDGKIYQARKVAREALEGKLEGLTKSLYFKSCKVDNAFFDKLKYMGRSKNLCFYK
jgi:spore germination cell wall hydrolase CwlJ-like protein